MKKPPSYGSGDCRKMTGSEEKSLTQSSVTVTDNRAWLREKAAAGSSDIIHTTISAQQPVAASAHFYGGSHHNNPRMPDG